MTTLEAVLRRDRWFVVSGLVLITTIAWLYLVLLARAMNASMTAAGGMAMMQPRLRAWTATEFLLMFVMWAVMMVAMMVPSVAPMILLHARVQRQRVNARRPFLATASFAFGYLLAWTGFSLAATTAQLGLERAALLSPMMTSTSVWLGAGVLLATGVYQLTPLKHACLQHCRSPLTFVTQHWRPGAGGGLLMGIEHGFYCIGCCWFLMALLFVGGVMNLAWVAVIAGFVLLEKVAPAGQWVSRVSGVLMLTAGIWILLAG